MNLLPPMDHVALDLVWLRGFNMTHLILVAVFYLLWRLPGHHRNGGGSGASEDVVIWYDAVQTLQETHGHNSNKNDDDDDDDATTIPAADDAYLRVEVPASTPAERRRFGTARRRPGVVAAARALRVYAEWHAEHETLIRREEVSLMSSSREDHDDDGVGVITRDERNWRLASRVALKVHREADTSTPLPQIAHLHRHDDDDEYRRDVTGRRILHFLPGRMDDRLADTVTYATATALYVDLCLDRHDTERVTVVIDARGGRGWRNLNAAQLLPFIRHLSALMVSLFPQRLYRCVVFPVPPRFAWVWRLARRCLDTVTRDKIVPLTGPSSIDAPPPSDGLAEYIGADNARYLETFRKAAFTTVAS